MEVITWLNTNSGAITAIATVVLVGITAFYAWVTKKMLEENRQLRLDAHKPEIAIYLRSHPARIVLKFLCVENIGAGAAHDVRFRTDLSFTPDGKDSLENVRFLKEGINYLQPGGKRECLLASIVEHPELTDKLLDISVTYKDLVNKEHERCFCLNFGEGIGSSHDGSPFFKIAEALENIHSVLISLSQQKQGD